MIRISVPSARPAAALALLLAALPAAPPAAAQADAGPVVRAVVRQGEARGREVRALVVEQAVSGTPMTLRLTRDRSGGGEGWTADTRVGPGGGALVLAARELTAWQLGLPAFFRRHAARFRLQRADTVGGRPVHVVTAETPAGAGGLPAGATRGTFWVDAERGVPLRVELRGEVVNALGEREPVETTLELSDHRDVGGVLLPFRSVVRMSRTGMLPPRVALEGMRAALDTLRARPGATPAQRETWDAQARMLDAALQRGVLEVEIVVRRATPER